MAEYTPRGSAVKRYHEGRQSQPANGGNQTFEPGYVDVPGKGRRYRNASGEYFQNHFGSILNSFKKAKDGAGDAYNNYYNSVADAAGTERRDGSVAPIVGGYNEVNDKLTAGDAMIGNQQKADNFLGTWMNEKLPEIITGLAVRVVDDGSGTVAKEVLDAGKGEGFLGGLFR